MNKTILLALAILPFSARAEIAERWLPTGEEKPSVIEHVYRSPWGDLEFLKRGDSHSVLLRNVKGALTEMTHIKGPIACDEWFISEKSESLPRGCEFQFYSQEDGTFLNVRSEEMEESNLFQAVSGSVRERGKHVAL
ncbi:MAG: hypothetical protein AB7K68_10155 [Bacteriovoracia bacterium]